jgi:hypothetical protein
MAKIGSMILIYLMSAVALAAVNVQSSIDRNEMGMGDTLTLTVSITSTDSVEASEPHIPQLEGFDLVNSWTSSSSSSKLIQSGGGMKFETVRAENYNYMLTPKHAGTIKIPAIEVRVDGKNYSTKQIEVKVDKQGSGAAKRPNIGIPDDTEDPLEEADQMFQQLLQRHGNLGRQMGIPNAQPPPPVGRQLKNPAVQAIPTNMNEAFSVQVEIDKTDVFEGEQVVANWYIYTRGNLLSLDRLKFPDLKGFWKEIIEEVPALNFTQEIVNGLPYRKALLASHALFPIRPGTAIVDEYKIKGQVQVPSGPMSAFGFGPAYTFERASKRIKIEVKPLPVENKPQDFAGAVGDFNVAASVEGQQFPVNQPFSFKVRFEGEGNAKLIELPNLNLPPGVEIYDTKNESKYFKDGKSYKQFTVLIIPRSEGVVKIPALSFSMFDPRIKKYVTRSTEAIEVKVTPALEGAKGKDESVRISKDTSVAVNVNELPALILTWDSSSDLWRNLENPYIALAAFLMVLLLLAYKLRLEFGSTQKRKDFINILQKRIVKLNSEIESGQYRKVGTEMTNLIYLILGNLAGAAGAGYDLPKLLELAPPSVRRELGQEIFKYVDVFQTLSFAPEEAIGNYKAPSELRKYVDLTKNLLAQAIARAEEKIE